jgi:hypothetical protein
MEAGIGSSDRNFRKDNLGCYLQASLNRFDRGYYAWRE